MNTLQAIEIVHISDSDEPEEAILAGMERSDFDGVIMVLLPDGEPGEHGWYDTPDTKDGRPTRPLLVFHKGYINAKARGLGHVSEREEEPIANIAIVAEWERCELEIDTSNNKRILEVHMSYPPYPWFEAAVIGMQMGQHFDDMEMVGYTEPTHNQPAKYIYSFCNSAIGKADV